MNKLRPSLVAAQFGYKCPSCDMDYWFAFDELKAGGAAFFCCGDRYYLETMVGATVNPKWGSTPKTPLISEAKQGRAIEEFKLAHTETRFSADDLVGAYRMLKGIGYGKEIVMLLRSVKAEGVSGQENLVKETLKRLEI